MCSPPSLGRGHVVERHAGDGVLVLHVASDHGSSSKLPHAGDRNNPRRRDRIGSGSGNDGGGNGGDGSGGRIGGGK